MISNKIKQLRELNGFSQAELARRLDVTRSSVNAWEMGLSTPTTQYVVDMARLFHITTDNMLGLEDADTISLRACTDEEKKLIMNLLHYMDSRRNP